MKKVNKAEPSLGIRPFEPCSVHHVHCRVPVRALTNHPTLSRISFGLCRIVAYGRWEDELPQIEG